ncbi:MFS transporter [Pseudonocardia kunmingensis]|uniref:Putative MFS family arabinose efflux permease n=1 Tax=Pseudonocardia kunmingensis TaxID=630975 RepID=A0A543DKZ9_9PSEU|nr:MFS transporter [Pseudonocardia kunmingensis]TQM09999.1 putative MFS family arabinose efflux permease [Pseudonocardia kunmingensis]
MTEPAAGRADAAQASAPSPLLLAVAGSASVATTFGMARYGYGLLLPDIQEDLALGVGVLGVIGSLAYAGYLLGTALVARCVERAGQRATVVGGGVLAVAGTVVVALAGGPVLLGAGVAVAGASAGLVFAPFGEAVRGLPSVARARTLATISCGTGWGVAVAAPIAILTGDTWRTAYVGFAVCAALSTLLAARTLPGRAATAAAAPPAERAAPGRPRSAVPMLVAALLIGLGSATFWTFAVDQVRDAGLDQAAGRILLGVAGATSLTGVAAADVITRLGARLTFVLTALLEAVALAVIAVAPDHLVAVLVAAAAFGVAYNTIVAVSVLWATRVYAERPAAGVAAATGAQGVGLLFGPLTGGVLAASTSLTTALLGGAAIVAAAAFLAPRRDVVRDRVGQVGAGAPRRSDAP